MSSSSAGTDPLQDPEATALLRELVALHPSNLEDPVRERYEKPRYRAAVDRIAEAARAWGLATRLYDAASAGADPSLRGIPRPNLLVDLDVGAPQRVLVLAHYDVVPVAEEQLGRWKSPPRELTPRPDGRWYGRGANDDLGCGVVGSLLALKRLARGPKPPRNVRLLVCCDEETGGEGGIEALKHHDAPLPPGDPRRFVLGDVALIPDGSPHATPASSGVAFLDASFEGPAPLRTVLDVGRRLVELHAIAAAQRSRYASPDHPSFGAPAPVLTGRATLTKIDLKPEGATPPGARLVAVHAETDATNFIPEAVTVAADGPWEAVERLGTLLGASLPGGFLLEREGATAVPRPPGGQRWQLVGLGGHGGSPHRARNPVPVLLDRLASAVAEGVVDGAATYEATFGVDLRLIPEATFAEGLEPVLAAFRAWAGAHAPAARLVAPPHRCRTGYALPLDDPALVRLAGILRTTLGTSEVFGEYGGTDASSLSDVLTPAGRPIPALVFGSMDRPCHIHDAEESVDPRLLAGVSETIRRFVAEP